MAAASTKSLVWKENNTTWLQSVIAVNDHLSLLALISAWDAKQPLNVSKQRIPLSEKQTAGTFPNALVFKAIIHYQDGPEGEKNRFSFIHLFIYFQGDLWRGSRQHHKICKKNGRRLGISRLTHLCNSSALLAPWCMKPVLNSVRGPRQLNMPQSNLRRREGLNRLQYLLGL